LKLSCGIIHIVDHSILLCHVTKRPQWDIPKGEIEAGETPMIAAVRELQEETGIALHTPQICRLIDMGEFSYLDNKRLHLFILDTDTKLEVSEMSCLSMVIPKKGKSFPEVDSFKYVPIEELDKYASAKMLKVLQEVLIRRGHEILD
jgi:predicted NUDIX family NTP pyrophosphohydrolase